MLTALLGVFALCIAACARRSEPGAEQTLELRRGGVPVHCDGRNAAAWTVIRGQRIDRYGFRQRIPGSCRFELVVPELARLVFRVEVEASAGEPGSPRAAIAAEVGGIERPLFEAELGPEARSVEGSVELPPGRASVMLSATRGTASRESDRLAWSDLAVHTRDPAFAGALPWWTDPQRALAGYFGQTTGRRTPAPGKRRLLLLGIDGANWERMQHLLDAGEMPALASLRGRGRWGVLRSTTVPESAMAWTAMRTGVGPAKNGVYTFLSGDTPRRSFWHLLGDRGLESVIVAVPKASPATPFPGILVGGWTLQRRDPFAWPPELTPHLLRAGYDPSLVNLRNVGYYAERMRQRTRVALELLANVDWDLAFVVYEYSDTVGHRFGLFTEEWDAVYRAVDAEIAALLEAADERTTILIVSDHGWKSYPKSVSLDAWLARNGFSGWKASLPASGNAIGVSAADSPNGARPDAGREAGSESLERVMRGLRDLTDPQTGATVVERVEASHLRFEGPYAAWAPGRLLVELREDYRAAWKRNRRAVFRSRPKQHHSHAGIYLLAGPGIAPGPGGPRSIFDVAPTVLRFFGIAPPEDAEGRSLHDFGVAEPLAAPGRSYFEGALAQPPPEPALSPELEEGLRALGYVE